MKECWQARRGSNLQPDHQSVAHPTEPLRYASYLESVGKFNRGQIDNMLSYFSQKIGFDISCKLSTMETICIKCQNLFSGKNKKKIFQNVI